MPPDRVAASGRTTSSQSADLPHHPHPRAYNRVRSVAAANATGRQRHPPSSARELIFARAAGEVTDVEKVAETLHLRRTKRPDPRPATSRGLPVGETVRWKRSILPRVWGVAGVKTGCSIGVAPRTA